MTTSFRARFEQRMAKTLTGVSEDLWRYREAAAVLVAFDYETLQPHGEVSPSSSAKTELLAECDVVYLAAGMPTWTLRTSTRQTTLHRLLAEDGIKSALAANPNRPDTFTQRLLERLLENHQASPAVVRARAAFGSPEENQALLQVVEWLSGVAEFEGKLPRLEDIKQRITQEHLLDPFRQLVGLHFAGRRIELEQLADYVGFHDSYSAKESFRRFAETVFNIKERPPLFINGPGGSGKSTLIAKFILDHAAVERGSRFPYAYLDFDRVALRAEEPITLLFDIMRQLAIQFPEADAQYQTLASLWSSRLTEQTSGSEETLTLLTGLRLENRDSFLSEFAGFVNSLKKEDQPLLLVLDTFEEIQFRSTAFSDEIFDFLNELQRRLPRLRTVLCGRAEIESKNYKFTVVKLPDFDAAAAVSYLAGRGLTNTQVAQQIFSQVGGSPLVLRLAADVAKLENVDEKGIEGLSSWLPKFLQESIEAVLYKRILKHVYNERIEALAYPGLVLRTITPQIVLEVLGPACEVTVTDLDDARALVQIMKSRLSTILVPQSRRDDPQNASDAVLVHRPDMRFILLSDLTITAQKKPDIKEKLIRIHTGAAQFYSRFDDPAQRAEELYHRLAMGVDRSVLNERWMDGLLPYLGSSIRELPAPSQLYLASRLQLELPEALWKLAEDEDWILYATRLVDQTLSLQKAPEALQVLRERKHLWTHDALRPIVTKVVSAVFLDFARQYEELRETYPSGDQRTSMMNALYSTVMRLAEEVPVEPSFAPELFNQGRDGQHLVALAIINANPQSEQLDIAIAAIRNARSPFEQFHALLVARLLFDRATHTQRGQLLRALRVQEGTPIHESDSSRTSVRDVLLKKFSTFSIEVLPAGTGDCLILHYGAGDDPGLALIDGGPPGFYKQHLRPRLSELRSALAQRGTLTVDLLMISNNDDNHVRGALDLTNELVEAMEAQTPAPLRLKSVWHNTLDVNATDPAALRSELMAQFGSSVYLNSNAAELDDVAEKLLANNLLGLHLRTNLQRLNVPVNQEFKGRPILARSKSRKLEMHKRLRFTVVGPSSNEFGAGLGGIIVLAELDNKRMLLTGGARSGTVLNCLEMVGLLTDGKLHVDLLKIPYPGHLDYEFFNKVTADHYIMSGSGEDGYPDRELFEGLMKSSTTSDYRLHLSYSIAEIDANRRGHWKLHQADELDRGKSIPDWSNSKNSLQYLIDTTPEFAAKIVEPGNGPHIINLLDDVCLDPSSPGLLDTA